MPSDTVGSCTYNIEKTWCEVYDIPLPVRGIACTLVFTLEYNLEKFSNTDKYVTKGVTTPFTV